MMVVVSSQWALPFSGPSGYHVGWWHYQGRV